MTYKTICQTDADFLLEFSQLENNGFAFKYAKWKDNILHQYVNCNGKVFGPYEDLSSIYVSSGKAEWTVFQSNIILENSDNGNKCETKKLKKSKKKKRMEVLTQDEIDKLLTAIAEGEANSPEEEYDEKTHILKLNRKKQEFFVVGKKRYGPYHQIHRSEYLDEEHFHFTYRKRKNSKGWFYNCNGKELGPFNSSNYMNIRYDEQNRAILDDFNECNYVYVDGEKIQCFDALCNRCSVYNYNGHEIFTGVSSDESVHYFKRDGIDSKIKARSIQAFDNGDIVYSKIENDTETWFYNDIPISVTVKGHSSEIKNSIITYKRKEYHNLSDIPFFMMEGKEYNGESITEYNRDSIDEDSLGFVWLQNGKILFFPQEFSNYSFERFRDGTYYKQLQGNFLRLFYTHRLAGRD
jgi:hypothetical protein